MPHLLRSVHCGGRTSADANKIQHGPDQPPTAQQPQPSARPTRPRPPIECADPHSPNRKQQINPLRYANADGTPATDFPANPNGAEEAAAAVCNARGNVLAIMPHPERAQDIGAVSRAIAGPMVCGCTTRAPK